MSVLRANQLEACEKALACLPDCGLFDADVTDADAETLFDLSFYAAEDRRPGAGVAPVLHTIESLRARVLSALPAELSLLSMDEHDLLLKTALTGGHFPLTDWNDVLPARNLARRLWCRVEKEEDRMSLILPRQLCVMVLLRLAAEDHRAIREKVEQVADSIDNTLYLTGIMQASAPRQHLAGLLKGTVAEDHPALLDRFLHTSYDYIHDRGGHMLLIHPGLAEPEHLLRRLNQPGGETSAFLAMNNGDLNDANACIEDLEDPLYERMLFQLLDVVRPELTPEDAVEDLIILAKQEVPFPDMEEVLSSMLICIPTPEMLRALKDLSDQIPRWLCLSSSRVQ